jgi:uncharacterized membrane-anchored protein
MTRIVRLFWNSRGTSQKPVISFSYLPRTIGGLHFLLTPIGYVKDDEKIYPDALLQQLKDSDAAANEERKRLGIPPLYTEGWYVPPHYDVESKRLEWGLKLRSEGQVVLNYTIRLLGRTGVMNATLVSDPETLDADVRTFKAALSGFEFNW